MGLSKCYSKTTPDPYCEGYHISFLVQDTFFGTSEIRFRIFLESL